MDGILGVPVSVRRMESESEEQRMSTQSFRRVPSTSVVSEKLNHTVHRIVSLTFAGSTHGGDPLGSNDSRRYGLVEACRVGSSRRPHGVTKSDANSCKSSSNHQRAASPT